jgi:hypothetical protein
MSAATRDASMHSFLSFISVPIAAPMLIDGHAAHEFRQSLLVNFA